MDANYYNGTPGEMPYDDETGDDMGHNPHPCQDCGETRTRTFTSPASGRVYCGDCADWRAELGWLADSRSREELEEEWRPIHEPTDDELEARADQPSLDEQIAAVCDQRESWGWR